MKNCPKCNAQLDDGVKFCVSCGAPVDVQAQPEVQQQAAPQPEAQTPPQGAQQNAQSAQGAQQPFTPQQPFAHSAPSDNRKMFSVLAYIPLLWLIGLLVAPEKNDARVRFNVGQGIIANIAIVVLNVAAAIIRTLLYLIFRTEQKLWGFGTGVYSTPGFVNVLSNLLAYGVNIVSLLLIVYGIYKVCKDEDAYLPVIGKFAFYK